MICKRFVDDKHPDGERYQYVGISALEFLVLTGVRAGEAVGADWSEIDVNTPPPKGGGFRLRLKAGLVRLRRTWRQLG